MLEILLETVDYLFETLEVIVNYLKMNYINDQTILGNKYYDVYERFRYIYIISD